MKYLLQFGVILAVSFAGELLKYFIPLPVPASIYGLILMLLLLVSGFVKLDMVENAADFLIKIMPLMFIPAVVGLTESYTSILTVMLKIVIVTVVTTVVVMAVCGRVVQAILKRKAKKESDDNE